MLAGNFVACIDQVVFECLLIGLRAKRVIK